MKKLILITILVGLIAAPALANFTFTTAQVLSFGKIDSWTNDSDAVFEFATTDAAVYAASYGLPLSSVGLVGHSIGEYTPGTVNYIGLGITGVDLSGYTDYVVTLNNDNGENWQYKLFADDGSTPVQSGNWVTISEGTSQTLSLDITGLGSSATIGILVGDDVHENTIHTSIVIPAPGAILLGGIGVCLVGWLRRRRAL